MLTGFMWVEILIIIGSIESANTQDQESVSLDRDGFQKSSHFEVFWWKIVLLNVPMGPAQNGETLFFGPNPCRRWD